MVVVIRRTTVRSTLALIFLEVVGWVINIWALAKLLVSITAAAASVALVSSIVARILFFQYFLHGYDRTQLTVSIVAWVVDCVRMLYVE